MDITILWWIEIGCDGEMKANTEDFARIHRKHLSRLPGVRQMQSSFALRTVVQTTALVV